MRKPTERFGKPGPRTRSSRGRTETLSLRARILIICEGVKTEPLYFKLFRVHPVVRIVGAARDTLRLVEEAEAIEERDGKFDEVWCVFDRDGFEADNYDNAISKIASKGYFPAYSNEAFELWFVLHFEFLNTRIGRKQYNERLTALLKTPYAKNSLELYRLIQTLGNEEQAMLWADLLLAEHPPETPHSQRCPATTVHHLVRRIRKLEQDTCPPQART